METEEASVSIIITGSISTGKTGLAYYLTGDPRKPSETTIANKLIKINYNFHNQSIVLDFWDTNGLEQAICSVGFTIKVAHSKYKVILFVYEIHEKDKFMELDHRLQELSPFMSNECVKILVANSFRSEPPVVSREEGEEKAKMYGMHYFETNLLTGEGTKELLDQIVLLAFSSKKEDNPPKDQNKDKPSKEQKSRRQKMQKRQEACVVQ
ncbi:ras family-domain-containing protein [Histomonas meleagridis]|uniref:ras family-domain-containing protein n=1 Tax=Histomonas meleagridis TaxID=135588 RepID=UPI00355985AD|nr:ras family-domain-containing protein [Histomonas meleagridis]KAH0801163.1 ras family-domain-containing protein [Histomonas meleagridis]